MARKQSMRRRFGSKKQIKGRWYIEFTGPDGKRHSAGRSYRGEGGVVGAFMPDKIDPKPAPPVSERMANGEIQVPPDLTPPADTIDEERNLVPHEWETTMDNRALLAIFANPALRGLAYNQLAERLDIMPGATLPWAGGKTVNSATRATLRIYLGSTAGISSARMVDEALAALPAFRAYHPVRDYRDNLPAWDGVQRLDTMLVDYLGGTRRHRNMLTCLRLGTLDWLPE